MNERLLELIDGYLANTLDAAGMAELSSILSDDPAARATFCAVQSARFGVGLDLPNAADFAPNRTITHSKIDEVAAASGGDGRLDLDSRSDGDSGCAAHGRPRASGSLTVESTGNRLAGQRPELPVER